jgi:lysophospholipase L1-like esterase
MNLCVSNAWSGDWLGSGKFRTRAVNLHNNTGATATNPDLIFVYIGINDISTWGGQKSASEWKVLYDELLGLITNKYKGAKIVCIGLTTNNGKTDYPNADTLVPQYNQAIKEISAKYGTLYVDQTSVINPTNFLTYMHDNRVLHPNPAGHELIFREIVKVLYKDLTK